MNFKRQTHKAIVLFSSWLEFLVWKSNSFRKTANLLLPKHFPQISEPKVLSQVFLTGTGAYVKWMPFSWTWYSFIQRTRLEAKNCDLVQCFLSHTPVQTPSGSGGNHPDYVLTSSEAGLKFREEPPPIQVLLLPLPQTPAQPTSTTYLLL